MGTLPTCCAISFWTEATTASLIFIQQFGNSCLFWLEPKQLYLTPCETTAWQNRHSILFVRKGHPTEVLPSCIYQFLVRNTWQQGKFTELHLTKSSYFTLATHVRGLITRASRIHHAYLQQLPGPYEVPWSEYQYMKLGLLESDA